MARPGRIRLLTPMRRAATGGTSIALRIGQRDSQRLLPQLRQRQQRVETGPVRAGYPTLQGAKVVTKKARLSIVATHVTIRLSLGRLKVPAATLN